jgi:hypothetical protein
VGNLTMQTTCESCRLQSRGIHIHCESQIPVVIVSGTAWLSEAEAGDGFATTVFLAICWRV